MIMYLMAQLVSNCVYISHESQTMNHKGRILTGMTPLWIRPILLNRHSCLGAQNLDLILSTCKKTLSLLSLLFIINFHISLRTLQQF